MKLSAKAGQTIALQLAGRAGWRTVRRLRLGAGGSFSAWVTAPGSYRAVYRGLAGPGVQVS